MLMLRMPAIVKEMESRTDMMFIAKPVWRKRVLNFCCVSKLVPEVKES